MPIATLEKLGDNSTTAIQTTVTISPSRDIQIGEKIILPSKFGANGTISSIADNSSQSGTANSYTVRATQADGGTTSTCFLSDCDVTRKILTTDTITVTYSASSTALKQVSIFAVPSGLKTGGPTTAQASGFTATADSGLATSIAGDVLIVGSCTSQANTPTVSDDGQGDTFTLGYSAVGRLNEYFSRTGSATALQYKAKASVISTTNWGMIVGVYQASLSQPSPGPVASRLASIGNNMVLAMRQPWLLVKPLLPGATPATGLSAAVTTALETDTALALGTITKAKAITTALETDTALAITGRKTLAIGTALETDSAFALGRAKRKAITTALETDSASIIAMKLGIITATETDTAFAITSKKAKTVTTALETDSAFTIASRKSRAITTALETDSSITITHRKLKAIGTALENDSSFVVTPIHRVVTALETDTAFTVAMKLGIITATESDTAVAIAKTKAKVITTTTETDFAFAVATRKSRLLGIATETDTALALGTAKKTKALTTSLETDSATTLSPKKMKLIGLATETDSAFTVIRVNPHTQLIGRADENDFAFSLTSNGGAQPLSNVLLRRRRRRIGQSGPGRGKRKDH